MIPVIAEKRLERVVQMVVLVMYAQFALHMIIPNVTMGIDTGMTHVTIERS